MAIFLNVFLSLLLIVMPYIMVAVILKKLNYEKFIFIVEAFAVITIMKTVITVYDRYFLNSFYYESQSYLITIEIIMGLILIKLFLVTVVFRKTK